MRGELLKLEINDRKFGPNVARVAATSGIKVLRTPTVRHEPMLSVSAFSISVRGACLGHFLILHEKHLSRLRRRLYSVLQSSSTSSRAWAALSAPLPNHPNDPPFFLSTNEKNASSLCLVAGRGASVFSKQGFARSRFPCSMHLFVKTR